LNERAVLAPTLVVAGTRLERRSRASWWPRTVEALTGYLPLLLMAALALGTWWLVQNTPLPDLARSATPMRHEPDYKMGRFTIQRFSAEGRLRAQIEGDTLRHYPDTDTLEIDNARIRGIAPDGRVTLASARRALSNGDGSEVQLMGDAHVVRVAMGDEEALDFKGEFLHAFLATERVRSHLPVVFRRGGTEVHADAFEYDNLSRLVQLKGRVRASLAPPGNAGGARR
jgi:lipopolysaccharide export system protein LptC